MPTTRKPLVKLFRAFSDESRLKILELLATHGEMTVTQLGTQLNQSQPAVSHHLAQLRHAGLLTFRREGKFNYYAVDSTGAERLFHDSGQPHWTFGGVGIRPA